MNSSLSLLNSANQEKRVKHTKNKDNTSDEEKQNENGDKTDFKKEVCIL